MSRKEKELYLLPDHYEGPLILVLDYKNGISPVHRDEHTIYDMTKSPVLHINEPFREGFFEKKMILNFFT